MCIQNGSIVVLLVDILPRPDELRKNRFHHADGLHVDGVLRVGNETYRIEPAHRYADAVVGGAASSPAGGLSVVFRESDMLASATAAVAAVAVEAVQTAEVQQVVWVHWTYS